MAEPSVGLVRLSNESVNVAWTGLDHLGHYVVRSAPVGLDGVHHSTTLSDPRVDSVLGALVPGPRADALALWRSTSGASGQASLDGRLFVPTLRRVQLGTPMRLARPGTTQIQRRPSIPPATGHWWHGAPRTHLRVLDTRA